MRTHILIINYNTADLSQRCLQKILGELGGYLETGSLSIALLNNGCTTTEEVTFDAKYVSIYKSHQNFGFAGGVNFLVKQIAPKEDDYLWLVNSDAMVERKTYVELLNAIKTTPENSIIGSLIMDSNNDKIYAQGAKTFNWKGYENFSSDDLDSSIVRVAAPSGASMLIPFVVFKELNGFDERYFVYVEEMDFCARALSLGYESFVNRSSRIAHEGGASSESEFKEMMLAKNYSMYARKNFPDFYWLITLRFLFINLMRLNLRRCYYYLS